MLRSRHLCRAILARSASAIGYQVSGNHLFARADYVPVARGYFRASVSEAPALHSARAVRLASILSATY